MLNFKNLSEEIFPAPRILYLNLGNISNNALNK